MGVHAHHYTMNMGFNEKVTDEWWDKLSERIKLYRPNFLTGDFNMSLMEVVPRLKKRDILISTTAWYPWIYKDRCHHGSYLGMDSCWIFHIGGDAECTPAWNINNVGALLREASRAPSPSESERSRFSAFSLQREDRSSGKQKNRRLDIYSGENVPGKHWKCYKTKNRENDGEFPLGTKLRRFLEQSTSSDIFKAMGQNKRQEQNRYRLGTGTMCMTPAYLRVKEKRLSKDEWVVDPETGQVHNGAHFPLFIATNNSTSRSKEAHKNRNQNRPIERQDWFKKRERELEFVAGRERVEAPSWKMSTQFSSNPVWLETDHAPSGGRVRCWQGTLPQGASNPDCSSGMQPEHHRRPPLRTRTHNRTHTHTRWHRNPEHSSYWGWWDDSWRAWEDDSWRAWDYWGSWDDSWRA